MTYLNIIRLLVGYILLGLGLLAFAIEMAQDRGRAPIWLQWAGVVYAIGVAALIVGVSVAGVWP